MTNEPCYNEPCAFHDCGVQRKDHDARTDHTYRTKAVQIELHISIIRMDGLGVYENNWYHRDDVGGYGEGRL